MFSYKYKVFLNDIWFDSLYGVDYYYDKPNFFAHGAKQFFVIYQISRSGDFDLTIIGESSGERFEFNDAEEFKFWVKRNYEAFEKHLDKLYWDRNPASKLNSR
ncbi:MAG: hypothetical protein ACR2HG_00670 [Pyrinomonadaceae bacterium]